MLERIQELAQKAREAIAAIDSEEILKETQVRLLGKKGELTALLKGMGGVSAEERPIIGKRVNELKQELSKLLEARKAEVQALAIRRRMEATPFDPTLPGIPHGTGAIHPLSYIQEELEDIFLSMGFIIPDYHEAESEFFNFESLNIPEDHPARDMQDTFWLDMPGRNLLRTHTSPGQVRAMREYAPPFKAIFPGKVYRYEAVDASHEHTFHQVEGILIDREVSVANLTHSMKVLLSEIFGRQMEIRLRPGYFPFVEPGFELDIRCTVCGGDGCPVCKQSGWLELLPCGLVHPNVIRFGGLDPDEWSGWAFGLGLSRLVMMKYGIDDIRLLMGGDARFVEQFGKV
jgi:phenylalanyl-tRNA synthetase alpha chain